jgi:hypothetical protein
MSLGCQGTGFQSRGKCVDKKGKTMRLIRQEDRWQPVAAALLGASPKGSFLLHLTHGQLDIEKGVLFFVERGPIAA